MRYIIFEGVNGAGKSTLYWTLPEDIKILPRINSDEILKSQGGDWKNENDVITAMRTAVKLQREYFKYKLSFTQETTLAGASSIKIMQNAKEAGYEVIMYYIGLDNVELAVERIRERVKTGGHGISEIDIRRRYETSLTNLKKAIALCDVVYIFDNTNKFVLFATYDHGNLSLYYDYGLGQTWYIV